MVQKINDFLRDYPFIRERIILVIRYVQYLLATIKRILKHTPDGMLVTGRRLTPAGENCYFGYYDKSPYSNNGKTILYHSIPAMRAPLVGEKASLYIQNISDGKRTKLGETLAWNLQQGSMLRYFGTDRVAWNDFRNGSYCTVIHNLNDGSERLIDYPLYDIDVNQRYGLSLEFERLNVDAEGYGYIQQGITTFDSPATISIVDIQENSEKVIIDSDGLNGIYTIPHEGVKFFYFNHLNFNPSGSRFLFIERYVYNHKRYSRLFSSDLNGEEIHLLADETMVSHFTWIDDNRIMVFCKHDEVDAYYIFADKEDHRFEQVQDSHLKVDGHPTFLVNSQNCFISDTYPDKGRRRHLFVYNIAEHKYKELAALKAPIKYDGPARCDFHPRLSKDGQKACIDSIHEGYRGIYEFDIRGV